MMAFSLTAFLLSVVIFWCIDASIERVGKSAVDASDETTNFTWHFDSSEEGLNEVFANLYNHLFHEDGSLKKKAVNDPDDFHCYKGNVKAESDIVYFNLSDFHKDNDELFQKAEILLELTLPLSKHPYLISLYDVETRTKIAHAEVLPGAIRQRLVFSVSLVVSEWVRKPRTNHAIQLMIERKIDGVIVRAGEEKGVFRIPLLVIYTTRVSVPIRSRRQSVPKNVKSKHVRVRRRPEEKPSLGNSTCFKRDLHVNMSQLLGDAVLYPRSVNVYTCAGTCKGPVKSNRQDNVTHHAQLRYRMQKLNLTLNKSDGIYCVPHKYKSMKVIMFDNSDALVVRTFTDLIVSDCKCVEN